MNLSSMVSLDLRDVCTSKDWRGGTHKDVHMHVLQYLFTLRVNYMLHLFKDKYNCILILQAACKV